MSRRETPNPMTFSHKSSPNYSNKERGLDSRHPDRCVFSAFPDAGILEAGNQWSAVAIVLGSTGESMNQPHIFLFITAFQLHKIHLLYVHGIRAGKYSRLSCRGLRPLFYMAIYAILEPPY